MAKGRRRSVLTQDVIVLIIAVLLFGVFSFSLNGFLDSANIISLVQSVSVIGILGIGIAVTIIGRGIDLSMVATTAMITAWYMLMEQKGTPGSLALVYAVLAVLLIGITNAILIHNFRVPAIFATLSVGSVTYGFSRMFLVPTDTIYLQPENHLLTAISHAQPFGVPSSVIMFAVLILVAALVLRWVVYGRFLYAIGDNPLTARLSGIPIAPIIIAQYTFSSFCAFAAGLAMAATVTSMNTKIFTGNILYDVILVVVLGGVSLSGGKGSITNVLIGTLLIGILLNGMVIADLAYTTQNIIKGMMLLVAIIIDVIVNPRDEQTAAQGDI